MGFIECGVQYPAHIDSISYLADRDEGLSRDINVKTCGSDLTVVGYLFGCSAHRGSNCTVTTGDKEELSDGVSRRTCELRQ